MRVFVTGATGFIGQSVVKELLDAGHQVLGLARSDDGAKTLSALGADVQRGSTEDLDVLKKAASTSDGVIHLAFATNFQDFEGECRKEQLAVETMGTALQGSQKPLVLTSGTLLLPQGGLYSETDPADPSNFFAKVRGQPLEDMVKTLAKNGVRVSIMRLAPTNHGPGDRGFVSALFTVARTTGKSVYIGDGNTYWPATHKLDAARAYRLALEKGTAGSVYHAIAEEGVTKKDIAEAIGARLNVPVVGLSPEEAQEHFGFMALPFGMDNRASSAMTQKELGWSFSHPTLVEDIRSGTYDSSNSKIG